MKKQFLSSSNFEILSGNKFMPFYDVVYNERRIMSNKIRYITKEEFIIKLVFFEGDFPSLFLQTYYIFPDFSPLSIFKMLSELYDNPMVCFKSVLGQSTKNLASSEPVEVKAEKNRQLVANAIREWMDLFYDFYDNEELLLSMEKFVKSNEEQSAQKEIAIPKALNTIKLAIEKYYSDLKDYQSQLIKAPIEDIGEGPIKLLTGDYSPEYIAQQLTLLEFSIAKNVKPVEYFRPDHPDSDNLAFYFNYINKIRVLIGNELLSDSTKNIIQLITIGVEIAEKCLTYNNFNTPIEILCAIYSPHLMTEDRCRLWDAMPQKLLDKIEKLSKTYNPENNYAAYKQEFPSFNSPYLPFLYAYVSEIRFLNEYNNNYLPEGLNYEKFLTLSALLTKVRSCFAQNYQFEVDVKFQKHLLSTLNDMAKIQNQYDVLSFRDIKSNYSSSLKLNYLRSKYDYFFTSTSIIGKEMINYIDYQLTPRDWQIITTGANLRTFQKDDCVLVDNNCILVLQEGTIEISRNGIKLNQMKAPAILNENPIFEMIALPQTLIPIETCAVEIIERNFLLSLLESDHQLASRYFATVAYQLYKQLNLLNKKDIKYVEVQSPKNYQPAKKQRVVVSRIHSMSLKANQNQKDLRDKEVRGLFSWGNDEVLIKEYKATLVGKTINAQGTLFISQHHVCFFAKVLTRKIKVVISFVEISKVQKKKNRLFLESFSALKKKKIELRLNNGEEEEAHGLISGIVSSLEGKLLTKSPPCKPIHHTSSVGTWKDNLVTKPKLNSFRLTEDDWELLKRGSKKLKVLQNNYVLHQNSKINRIFYLVKGICHIEIEIGDKKRLLGVVRENDFFGERSFIANKPATASVIVHSKEADILVFEGSYLKRLFRTKTDIEARFLYNICCSLLHKLEIMARYEDEEERKILDLILEPLYLSFHRHPIVSHIKRQPFHVMHGPFINEREEFEYCLNEARSYCAGTSISTYPLKQKLQISRDSEEDNPTEQIREGSPICDQYRAEFFHTRAIVAIADGCNWGDPPREAARAARDAFVQYLRKHHTEILDVQIAGALILRAFSIANHAIMREKTPGIQKVGTTTLLGGILVQLENSEEENSLVSSGNNNNNNNGNNISQYDGEFTSAELSNNTNHSWGFIYGSLGDCKAFHWSVKTKKFTDITLNNRLFTTNATDSGGRLGPYLPGDLPDLRNFELGFLPCDEGDYLLLISDGIHDNFDIAFLGKKPRDYDIDSDDWDNLPDPKAAEEIKNYYRLKKLEEVIFSAYEESSDGEKVLTPRSGVLPPPIDIVRNLMLYCRDICKPAANWMQKNPNRRLPKDFALYPGKMDHTTCICLVVKEQTEENDVSYESD